MTKEQWNQLNDEQKNDFQDEVGKKFDNDNLPSDSDILIFLGNRGLETGVDDLGDEEVPPGQVNLWQNVLKYFSK